MAVGTSQRARFGYTVQPCRLAVVAGANAFRRRHREVVLAHQAQHPLVAHGPTLAPQERLEPTIAIMPVRQRQMLQAIT